MTATLRYQKVGILDTNMLHFVGLYLKYAKERVLFPWPGHVGGSGEALNTLQGPHGSTSAIGALRVGCHLIKLTMDQEIVLRYGVIAELELLVGRIRGKAILHAANEGIPDRMWSKLRENEIRDRVRDDELKATADGVAEIGVLIDDLGLADKTANRRELPDAISVAREIVRNVYVETADSIVYASAILAGADFLFTTDTALRATVNRIQRPGDGGNSAEHARFRAIRDRLGRYAVTDRPGGDPLFPRAHTVSASGTVKPEFR